MQERLPFNGWCPRTFASLRIRADLARIVHDRYPVGAGHQQREISSWKPARLTCPWETLEKVKRGTRRIRAGSPFPDYRPPTSRTSSSYPCAADTAARRRPSGARPGATARTAGAQEPRWSRRRSPSPCSGLLFCAAGIRDRHRRGLLLAILQRRIRMGDDRQLRVGVAAERHQPRDRAAVLPQRNESISPRTATLTAPTSSPCMPSARR